MAEDMNAFVGTITVEPDTINDKMEEIEASLDFKKWMSLDECLDRIQSDWSNPESKLKSKLFYFKRV